MSRVFVIFGGAGYIGSHLARYALEKGMADEVVIADIKESDLPADPRIKRHIVDVRKPIPADLVSGSPQWIFNLAAVHREPGHQAIEYFDTNLKGAFHFTRAAARGMMRRRNGRIINITSVVGLTGNRGQANYAASKAGLIGLTKSVARELAPRNILCNAVAPGFIETEMTSDLSEAARDALLGQRRAVREGAAIQVEHRHVGAAGPVLEHAAAEHDAVEGDAFGLDHDHAAGGLVVEQEGERHVRERRVLDHHHRLVGAGAVHAHGRDGLAVERALHDLRHVRGR